MGCTLLNSRFAQTCTLTIAALALITTQAFAQADEDNGKAAVPKEAPAMGVPAAKGVGPSAGAVKRSSVSFLSPTDGAKLKSPFTARFSVQGLRVAPAGKIEPGTGHFHVLIDSAPVKEGEVVPTDANHLHFGKGQTEAPITLTPGKHTLTLQFADGAHRAYGPMLTKTITVEVTK